MRQAIHRLKGGWLGSVLLTSVVVAGCVSSDGASANTLEESGTFGGLTVNYRVVLPDNFDPQQAYPAVLAFPGGGQSERTVNGHLERFWAAQAEMRGYIVVSPAAPREGLYFQGGDRIFPEFLDAIRSQYKIEDGLFHAAGASNGGLSAFHIAAQHPEYFKSVTGLPGYLPQATAEQVEALRPLCIYMHAGERDTFWLRTMEEQSQQLEREGLSVRFVVEAGQEHLPGTLSGAGASRLYDQFDEAADGCR